MLFVRSGLFSSELFYIILLFSFKNPDLVIFCLSTSCLCLFPALFLFICVLSVNHCCVISSPLTNRLFSFFVPHVSPVFPVLHWLHLVFVFLFFISSRICPCCFFSRCCLPVLLFLCYNFFLIKTHFMFFNLPAFVVSAFESSPLFAKR